MKIVKAPRRVYILPDGTEYTKEQLQAYIKGLRNSRNTLLLEIDRLLSAANTVLSKGPTTK